MTQVCSRINFYILIEIQQNHNQAYFTKPKKIQKQKDSKIIYECEKYNIKVTYYNEV